MSNFQSFPFVKMSKPFTFIAGFLYPALHITCRTQTATSEKDSQDSCVHTSRAQVNITELIEL